jgi:DNA-binding transcriptional LysR family regulator
MPTLEGVKEFLQVVECGSFSKAAEKLELSTAQVSRLVTQLEKKLGVRLLYRSTRKISLTEEGELYYQKSKQSMGLLENVELEIGRKVFEPSGTLKINLSGWFQEVFMIPILIDFMKKYPDLEVSVTLTDNMVNVIEGGYDVMICAGELADSSVIAKKMATIRFCIVGSKEYFAHHPVPLTLEDLTRHNCLSGLSSSWLLSSKGKLFHHSVSGNWKSDNAHAVLAAVNKSLGLGHLPVIGVIEPMAQGELLEVMQDYTRKGVPVWAVYPNRNHISAKVRFFIDYLVELFGSDLFDEATRQQLMGQ